MIMLDRWEKLETNPDLDQGAVRLAKELSWEMLAKIFDTMGLTPVITERTLEVQGRGLTFVFPLRCEKEVPIKFGDRRKRAPTKRSFLPPKDSSDPEPEIGS